MIIVKAICRSLLFMLLVALSACNQSAPSNLLSPAVTPDGFPILLFETAKSTQAVTLDFEKPLTAKSAVLVLRVKDADEPDEGEIVINGDTTLSLFGEQASTLNSDTWIEMSYETSSDTWLDGTNTLVFNRIQTAGFEIEFIGLSFSQDSVTPVTPVTPEPAQPEPPSQPEPGPEEPAPDPQPEPDPRPEPEPKPQPEPTPNPQPDPSPNPEPEPVPKPAPSPTPPQPEPPAPEIISVTLSPKKITLEAGASTEFTATLEGSSNKAVSWSVSGGTISDDETSNLSVSYMAPDEIGNYLLEAVSVEDPSKSASAEIRVIAAPLPPLDTVLDLSNYHPSINTAANEVISSLYAFSSRQGTFRLTNGEGDRDNANFTLKDNFLMTKSELTKANYTIRVSWVREDGRAASQAFTLTTVSPETIVLGERLGQLAYLGQPASELRNQNPDRTQSYTLSDSYFFDELGFFVDVCRSSDTVIAAKLSKQTETTTNLQTAEGIGLSSTLDQLTNTYGEAPSIQRFGSYADHSYSDERNPNKTLSFGLDTRAPEDLLSIGVANRFCDIEN